MITIIFHRSDGHYGSGDLSLLRSASDDPHQRAALYSVRNVRDARFLFGLIPVAISHLQNAFAAV